MTISVPWWMKLIDDVLRSVWAGLHTAGETARYLDDQATVARNPEADVYIQPSKWRRCVGVARMYPLYRKAYPQ